MVVKVVLVIYWEVVLQSVKRVFRLLIALGVLSRPYHYHRDTVSNCRGVVRITLFQPLGQLRVRIFHLISVFITFLRIFVCLFLTDTLSNDE